MPRWAFFVMSLVAVGLLAGVVFTSTNRRMEVLSVAPEPPVVRVRDVDRGPILPVKPVVAQPERFYHQHIYGEARVLKVLSPRAFWVESEGGGRILAVVVPGPGEQPPPIEVRAGQNVMLQGAVFDPARREPDLTRLDEASRMVLHMQKVYVEVTRIEVPAMAAED